MPLHEQHARDLRAADAFRALINEAETGNDLPRLREAIAEHVASVLDDDPEIRAEIKAREDAAVEAFDESLSRDEIAADLLEEVFADIDSQTAKPGQPKTTQVIADREKDTRARLLAEVATTIEEIGEDALPSGITHPEIADAIREAMKGALARAHDAGALEAIEAIEGQIADREIGG